MNDAVITSRQPSVLEELEDAESAEQVYHILAKCEHYFAGKRTRTRWQSRAKRRLTQLRNGKVNAK